MLDGAEAELSESRHATAAAAAPNPPPPGTAAVRLNGRVGPCLLGGGWCCSCCRCCAWRCSALPRMRCSSKAAERWRLCRRGCTRSRSLAGSRTRTRSAMCNTAANLRANLHGTTPHATTTRSMRTRAPSLASMRHCRRQPMQRWPAGCSVSVLPRARTRWAAHAASVLGCSGTHSSTHGALGGSVRSVRCAELGWKIKSPAVLPTVCASTIIKSYPWSR